MRRTAALLLIALMAAACGKPKSSAVATPMPTAEPTTSASASPETTQPDASGSPVASPRTSARLTPRPSAAPATATTAGPPATPKLSDASVNLHKVATLSSPVAMEDLSGVFYVAEKGGRIRAVRGGVPDQGAVLNISGEVSTGSEQGLLGLAFSPDRRFLYVNFTNTSGDTVVREYAFADGRVDSGSARQVLFVDQPFANHNGGHLVFGPDGKLWIGLGDGGSGGDPLGNGQSLGTLLGKMLRIDPRPSGGQPYGIPPDNPFVGRAGARGEIWAYGLRNPWRYEFDKATKDLWIADVGQDNWEEIDFQPATSPGGENYGWNRMEGTHGYNAGTPPAGHVPPVYEYSHSEGCSVTGGFVYRGSKIRALQGAYVFADYCAGKLRAIAPSAGSSPDHRFLGPQVDNVSSFGQDESGEVYVLSLDGGLYRIDAA